MRNGFGEATKRKRKEKKNGDFGEEEEEDGSSNAIFLHLSGKNPERAVYDNVAGAEIFLWLYNDLRC